MCPLSLLPYKKITFPTKTDETNSGGCLGGHVEDIPDDIMDATKSLVLQKEEEKEKKNLEKQMKDRIGNIQEQQNEILLLLNKLLSKTPDTENKIE